MSTKFTRGQVVRHVGYDSNIHEDIRGVVVRIYELQNMAEPVTSYDVRWMTAAGVISEKTMQHEEFELVAFDGKSNKKPAGFATAV